MEWLVIAMVSTVVFGLLTTLCEWAVYLMWACLAYVFIFCMFWIYCGIKNKIKSFIE